MTIKNGVLLPSAGIDESNGEGGHYILYPDNVQQTAALIWAFLRNKYHIQDLGVLITDSTTKPLKYGVTGIALGWCGFMPTYSYIGKPDIFGQPLRVTQVNLLDALAASAVLIMGEGNECTPIALIHEAPKIQYLKHPPTREDEKNIYIPMDQDLYKPFLGHERWVYNPLLKKNDV